MNHENNENEYPTEIARYTEHIRYACVNKARNISSHGLKTKLESGDLDHRVQVAC